MGKNQNYLKSSFIPQKLKKRLRLIGKSADEEHVRIYVVGGFVRDLFLRRIVWDMDIVAESDPAAVLKVLDGHVTKHARYLTCTVAMDEGSHIDFATARKEEYSSPAALPVVSPGSMHDDLSRRDFTCNAMALGLNADNFGVLFDPFSGRKDLRRKLLRVFHRRSFEDDPTRIFRAARFMGRYQLKLEENSGIYLHDAIKTKYPLKLSRQRTANEFRKIISEQDPKPALSLLSKWELLSVIHPKIKQYAWKPIRMYPRPLEFSIIWFFQTGEPQEVGDILEDLRFDRNMIDSVVSLLSAIQALKAGKRITDSMLEEFCHEHIYNVDFLKHIPHIDRALIRKLSTFRTAHAAFLNGADLHQLGYVPGKQYGEILHSVRRRIWDRKIKTRQDAIRFVCNNFAIDKGGSS